MLTGSVLWCFRCGTYADKKAKGLKDSCKGKPPRQLHRGGMEGQLRKLRNGIRPKTGSCLPPAVELDPVILPIRVNADEAEHRLPEGFYLYEPAARPAATAVTYAEGLSCSDRQAALRDRIRANELANSMRHDVVSDVVSLSMAGDGSDVTSVGIDVVGTDASPCRTQVVGGGVWDYLFPHECQHGSAVTQALIIEKGEGESISSGTGFGEPHSWAVCTDDSPGAWSFRHRFD
jgi:hypothetical protein